VELTSAFLENLRSEVDMMAKKKLNPKQKKYQEKVRKYKPKPNLGKNALWAFVSGGLVCMLGQGLIDFYAVVLNLPKQEASNPAVATMILIGALLTALGVFDKLAAYAGAGLAVPVTGFANSMVSAGLEFKEEGLVQGVGAKIFSLSGSVITFGVVTAFFVGLFHALAR
jgi:stage V sporulation protein AC